MLKHEVILTTQEKKLVGTLINYKESQLLYQNRIAFFCGNIEDLLPDNKWANMFIHLMNKQPDSYFSCNKSILANLIKLTKKENIGNVLTLEYTNFEIVIYGIDSKLNVSTNSKSISPDIYFLNYVKILIKSGYWYTWKIFYDELFSIIQYDSFYILLPNVV